MANSLSGTYNFGSTQSDQIITDAYERIGFLPDLITGEKVQSAQRTINLLLSEWINRGFNQWTLTQAMLNLNPNQSSYALPATLSDIFDAVLRTSQRQLNGTAFSSAGGTASNAFDGNSTTACTQTSPNGYISYNYGSGHTASIQIVGITSFATLSYTLAIEYSPDNINWTTAVQLPLTTFIQNQNQWFNVPVPVASQAWRIRETGGATLNINEIYFNNTVNDIPISRISHAEYINIPNKAQTGRPTSYWIDRQISPNLYLWPTPNTQYNNLFYTYTSMMQDIGTLANLADIPQRFYEALAAGVAYKLAVKYAPEPARLALLKDIYDEAFNLAAREDSDRTPLRIFGDYSNGWSGMYGL